MKTYYRIAKKPFFGRFMIPWKSPLSEEQNKEWTFISFKSKSGALLKGMYSSPISDLPKATIVLGHPMGKEAKGYFLKNGYTDILRNQGYNVFIFDINGFGESEVGNFYYHEDIISAGNIAKDLFPNTPLGYFGISLGGQWATIAFAEKHHYDFAIIESAANTLDDFWVQYPFANFALKTLNTLNPKLKKKIRMIDRIKDAHSLQKVLFIYLDKDELIKDDAGYCFNQAIPIQSELHVISNAKHAQIPKSKSRHDYFNKIVTFFDSQTEQYLQQNSILKS
ncbi:alpha/beta hydrolase [uncultured Aquimarina sp.]|uniref:alpha/beta hydrolase n=1 Tax=uncultured Aquimarina sp. TaxID=575652 RepID=UPI00261A5087|nr:alpha/beta hydrolase [uncultured Aquimarina sp.]